MDSLASLSQALVEVESPTELIAAFRPSKAATTEEDARRRRTIAQIQLAQSGCNETLRAQLVKILSSSTASNDAENKEDEAAALALLTALYGSRPEEAHTLLLLSNSSSQQPLIDGLLQRTYDDDAQLSLPLSELLCAASGHGPSRKLLQERVSQGSSTAAQGPRPEPKIVEVTDEKELQRNGASEAENVGLDEWLRTWIDRAELQSGKTRAIGLLCALTLEKMRRGKERAKTKGEQQQEGGKEQQEEEKERESAETLFQLSRRFVVVAESEKEENSNTGQMASIEALCHLSLDAEYRERIASDTDLIKGLVVAVLRTCQAKQQQQMADAALLYGVATVLHHLVQFKPVAATAEERQMAKLRRMAKQAESQKAGDKLTKENMKDEDEGDKEEEDHRLEAPAVRARIGKVIECGAVAAMTAISNVKPLSTALLDTTAKTMLAMTTPQDRAQRGRIVQQGGARALFLLLAASSSSPASEQDLGKKKTTAAEGTTLILAQSLAHLLIDLDPRLVLRDSAQAAIVPLGLLFMSSASSTLQHFEACLALTNLASLSPDTCAAVARLSLPRRAVDPSSSSNQFRGAGAEEIQDEENQKINMLSLLDERLFFEDNVMARRACVELACNLAAGEDAFMYWSGDAQEEKNSAAKEEQRQRWAHLMVALCAYVPGSEETKQQQNGESSKATRLAAGGLLAMLSESRAVCARIAKLRTSTINILVRLVWPGVPPRIHQLEEDEDEAEEEEAIEDEEGERSEWDEGMALRGLTIFANVLERGPRACKESLLPGSGLVDALEKLIAASSSQQKEVGSELAMMAKQVYQQLH